MIRFFPYSFSLLRSEARHLVEKGSQRLSRLASLMTSFLTRLYQFFLLFFYFSLSQILPRCPDMLLVIAGLKILDITKKILVVQPAFSKSVG